MKLATWRCRRHPHGNPLPPPRALAGEVPTSSASYPVEVAAAARTLEDPSVVHGRTEAASLRKM
jgi:hypothetical protein